MRAEANAVAAAMDDLMNVDLLVSEVFEGFGGGEHITYEQEPRGRAEGGSDLIQRLSGLDSILGML